MKSTPDAHPLLSGFRTGRLSRVFSAVLVLAGITAISSCSRGGEQTRAPRPQFNDPGEIMSSARFIDMDGNEVALEQFEGEFLVVDFWESWCGPCLQVFPAMQQLTDEYPGEFRMLAVNVGMTDSREEASAFWAEREYTFTNLFDEYDVFEQFEIGSIPFKVYIGPDGEVITAELGSRGKEGDYNKAKTLFLENRPASGADGGSLDGPSASGMP